MRKLQICPVLLRLYQCVNIIFKNMIIKRICILGGTGFLGKTVANRLTKDSYQLRVLTRDREKRRYNLILLPTVDLVETNIHNQEQLNARLAGCDAVINLVGILNEKGRGGSGFRRAHVELAEKLIQACRQNGIKRLLQMSALNADAAAGPSHYLRTKGEAEDKVHNAEGIMVTSYRPSVIFGPSDSFFNRFAALLKIMPLVFPLACAGTRFAPVFVEDVAEAIARTIRDPDSYGRRFTLVGPRDYTLQQLVEYTASCLGIRRTIIPLPEFLSRLQAAVFDFVPDKPFSTDNYLSATIDSISDHNDLITLGITPTPLEAVVPQYLSRRFQRANYYDFRRSSGRHT